MISRGPDCVTSCTSWRKGGLAAAKVRSLNGRHFHRGRGVRRAIHRGAVNTAALLSAGYLIAAFIALSSCILLLPLPVTTKWLISFRFNQTLQTGDYRRNASETPRDAFVRTAASCPLASPRRRIPSPMYLLCRSEISPDQRRNCAASMIASWIAAPMTRYATKIESDRLIRRGIAAGRTLR